MGSVHAPWTPSAVLAAAQDARSRLDELDVIRRKGPRTVLRYAVGAGPTVILKIWETDSWRSRLACALPRFATGGRVTGRALCLALRLGAGGACGLRSLDSLVDLRGLGSGRFALAGLCGLGQ